MPTYGYRCPNCGTEFDVVQRMSDPPGADCPNCGAAAKRMFHPAGIVFKGSGFHKTDYRSSSGGGSSSSSSTTGGTSDSSPSKPATDSSPPPKPAPSTD